MAFQRFERRQHARLPTDEIVRIRILTVPPQMVPEKELAGRVIDISAKGMRLVLDQPIPLSTPLRIDGFNTMFLGEACHCVPVEGKWQVGIQLEHYVANVEELAALTLNRI